MKMRFMPTYDDLARVRHGIYKAIEYDRAYSMLDDHGEELKRQAIDEVRTLIEAHLNECAKVYPATPVAVMLKHYHEFATAEAKMLAAGRMPQRKLAYHGHTLDAFSFYSGIVAAILDMLDYPDAWERPI